MDEYYLIKTVEEKEFFEKFNKFYDYCEKYSNKFLNDKVLSLKDFFKEYKNIQRADDMIFCYLREIIIIDLKINLNMNNFKNPLHENKLAIKIMEIAFNINNNSTESKYFGNIVEMFFNNYKSFDLNKLIQID